MAFDQHLRANQAVNLAISKAVEGMKQTSIGCDRIPVKTGES